MTFSSTWCFVIDLWGLKAVSLMMRESRTGLELCFNFHALIVPPPPIVNRCSSPECTRFRDSQISDFTQRSWWMWDGKLRFHDGPRLNWSRRSLQIASNQAMVPVLQVGVCLIHLSSNFYSNKALLMWAQIALKNMLSCCREWERERAHPEYVT